MITENPHWNSEPVTLEYEELWGKQDLSEKIERAFGLDGLGLIIINNVPRIKELRQELLPQAYNLGHLSDEEKAALTHPKSFYSFGWSHGKEVFKGKPDYSKGSFYANPIFDTPYSDLDLIEKFPTFCHPNIWPRDVLPGLEGAFKSTGKTLVDLGLALMRQCDRYLQERIGVDQLLLPHLTESRTHKGRLLYYFANDPSGENASNWCGWHRDHGTLTGLLPAMFFDAFGNPIKNPDPEAGLYVYDRRQQLVRVSASENQVIFQLGEIAQILSGGVFQATPHYVRSPRGAEKFSRSSFALFMEPHWNLNLTLPSGAKEGEFMAMEDGLCQEVPSLRGRWESGLSFEQFSMRTFRSYLNA